MKKLLLAVIVPVLALALAGCSGGTEEVVNLYTTRHYDADDALYEAFTEETGIVVNVVSDDSQVSIEEIKSQGESPVADIFMTADAGNLAKAKEEGILQPITSDVLEANIPEQYQDSENYWFGLTKRARVLLYSTERVTESELATLTYESVATNSRWTDNVLVRSSSNIYNQSLVAAYIAMYGETAAQSWVEGIVSQMARNPEGNDRKQAVAISNGEGDLAIANSYYYGKLIDETNQDSEYYGVTDVVGIFFPGQGEDEDGVHVNISGAGIVKNAKNKDNAVKLLEFLSEVEQQEAFSSTNYEFPVNENAEMSDLLQGWLTDQGITTLKEFELDLTELGTYNEAALNMMIAAGWDTPKE